jgi:hypothetical protein
MAAAMPAPSFPLHVITSGPVRSTPFPPVHPGCQSRRRSAGSRCRHHHHCWLHSELPPRPSSSFLFSPTSSLFASLSCRTPQSHRSHPLAREHCHWAAGFSASPTPEYLSEPRLPYPCPASIPNLTGALPGDLAPREPLPLWCVERGGPSVGMVGE